jgi:hypothetical protein
VRDASVSMTLNLCKSSLHVLLPVIAVHFCETTFLCVLLDTVEFYVIKEGYQQFEEKLEEREFS